MKRLAAIALSALCVICTGPGPCAAEKSSEDSLFSGSAVGVASRSLYPAGTGSGEATEDTFELRVRLKLAGRMTDTLRGELAYEFAPTWQHMETGVPVLPDYRGFIYRADDMERVLYPGDPGADEEFFVSQNLDRAYITWSTRSLDLHAGRQAVAFGSARGVNPTDVLAPYAFDTIARTERVGVDALRLKAPLGDMSELDMGLVFGDDFRQDQSAGFLRLKGYALQTDVALIAMRFRNNSMAGLDVSRSIGGASAWLEAARVFANTPGNDYASFSMGADYAFTETTYAFLEYHRNGAGTEEPALYFVNVFQEAYMDAGVYLLGKHYLIPGLTWQLTPLVSISLEAMLNMDDDSALGSAALEYNATEDLYLTLGGFAGLGRAEGKGIPTEFGQYPDTAYLLAGYYF